MKRIYSFLFVGCVLMMGACRKTGDTGTSMDGSPYSLSGGGGGAGGSSGGGNAPTPGVLTAGEWNDLDHWDYWKGLLQRDTLKDFPASWGFYTTNRVTVTLHDAQGKPVPDAQLTLTGGSASIAVTNNFGKAEFFPDLFVGGGTTASYTLRAGYGGQSFDLGAVPAGITTIEKNLPVARSVARVVDVAFVVDATGSMGDEISYLKTELNDVATRAGAQLPNTQLRLGSVFYRDHGDAYLVRPFNFTTDVSSFTSFIRNQSAGGGGDYEEAVEEGLREAVNNLSWSDGATNRIIFLVLDAPAHNTDAVKNQLHGVIAEAQRKGIRIIPVSASGISRSTEFFLRFLSVSTNGTYVFITDDSGIGGPHLEPTVGPFQVEFLNNLLVRLITKYGKAD